MGVLPVVVGVPEPVWQEVNVFVKGFDEASGKESGSGLEETFNEHEGKEGS